MKTIEKPVKGCGEFSVEGMGLLSEKEYLENEEIIKNNPVGRNKIWWLSTPVPADKNGDYGIMRCIAGDEYSNTTGFGDLGLLDVRPKLKISNLKKLGYERGDKIELLGERWTVLSEDTALCDEVIGKSQYHDVLIVDNDILGNEEKNYENSAVKQFLDEWFEAQNNLDFENERNDR